ncbi:MULTISPECIES: glycosyltransferase [Asaia]|uniref:glycosyltransferase n=1 Tax=Asaia TaxID=91914 RepID=UPI002FC35D1A
MHILHIALGGCLRAPPVTYGITPDTGGHIAYVLGAALAQERCPEVNRITIVTRRFSNERLDAVHDQEIEPVSDKITIVRLGAPGGPYCEKEALSAQLPALSYALRRLLARPDYRPDVAHVHFADAASLALSMSGSEHLPVVYTPHALGIDKLHSGGAASPALYDRIALETCAIRDADALIVSTRDEADCQIPRYGVSTAREKTHIISPGVPALNDVDAEHGAGFLKGKLTHPERPLILAIARPVEKKNLATLATLYAQDTALQRKANLVILSGQHTLLHPGTEEAGVVSKLKQIRARYSLDGCFALPSSHSPDDVAGLYRHAAASGGVFVNPARHEPFGLTLLEAASAGLPVIATNQGGPVDILNRLGHGLLVSPDSPDALRLALHRLLDRPELRQHLATAARRAAPLLDWEAYARASIAVYRSLARKKHDLAPCGFATGSVLPLIEPGHAALSGTVI